MNAFSEFLRTEAKRRALLPEPEDSSAAHAERLRTEIDQVTEQSRALIRKQATAPLSLASIYDEELTALGTRLDALQREAGRIQSTAQPSPDMAIARVRALGLEGFWQLDDGEQNAILHGLFGNWRIAVNAREVVGFKRVAH